MSQDPLGMWGHSRGRGLSGDFWPCPLTGSPVPQLMRMVLHESLKTLKMRAWEERSVPSCPAAAALPALPAPPGHLLCWCARLR